MRPDQTSSRRSARWPRAALAGLERRLDDLARRVRGPGRLAKVVSWFSIGLAVFSFIGTVIGVCRSEKFARDSDRSLRAVSSLTQDFRREMSATNESLRAKIVAFGQAADHSFRRIERITAPTLVHQEPDLFADMMTRHEGPLDVAAFGDSMLAWDMSDTTRQSRVAKDSARRYDDIFSTAFRAMKDDQYSFALGELNKYIALVPNNPLAYNNRALCKLMLGDTMGALADIDQVIRFDANHTHSLAIRGAIRARRGDIENAVADYRTAAFSEPDAKERAVYLVDMGVLLKQMGRYLEAKEAYLLAMKSDSTDASIAFNLANLAVTTRDVDSADRYIGLALKIDSNYSQAWSLRGDIKYHKKDWLTSATSYSQAIRRESLNAEYRYSRAQAYFNAGRYSESEADLRTTISLDSTHAPAMMRLAALLYGSGRLQEALRYVLTAERFGHRLAPLERKRVAELIDSLRLRLFDK